MVIENTDLANSGDLPSFLVFDAVKWGEWGKEHNIPTYRSQQIMDWIYQKRVFNPDQMSNLGAGIRGQLRAAFNWELPLIVSRLDSSDGATKLLLKLKKNQLVETVILRYENRVSVCVSSQVGCRLACTFCQTGKLGFFRHLDADEILAQYYLAQHILDTEENRRRISHVVFMGMGEPLDNYDNTILAVNRLLSEAFFGLSARNVTISTSGIAPAIQTLAKDTRASLAVSLHAATDELRSELMPINKRYDLAEVKAALVSYQKQTNHKITIEYILIKNKNADIKQAKALVKYLHGLKAKVNLIPFNPHPGLPFDRPGAEEIRAFQEYLATRGYPAPVRYSLGLEVSGGCGQLAAKTESSLTNQPKRKSVITLE